MVSLTAVAWIEKRLPGAMLLALAAVLLTACGHTPGRSDSAPARKLNPADIQDAVPKREPITKAGNKSPYTVLGQTYVLLPSAKGYRATGMASWYGTKFHGQSTSNGDEYDLYGMTAAHKTLPIPTYVLVTNLENNRQAVVRVNDRGPFVGSRLIDLSYAAAVKLGYADKGTAFVEVAAIDVDNWPPRKPELVPPPVNPPLAPPPVPGKAASTPTPAPQSETTRAEAARTETTKTEATRTEVKNIDAPDALPVAGSGFYVQAGAFSHKPSADNLRSRLVSELQQPVEVKPSQSTPVLYRVRVGPLDRATAEQVREHILSRHISEAARVLDESGASN